MSTTAKMPMIKLSAIVIGKSNPRKAFDEDAIKELSESIAVPVEVAMERRIAALRKRAERNAKKYHLGDSTIKKYYLSLPVKVLAEKIGRSATYIDTRLAQLGLVIPREIIEQRIQAARRQPGSVPANKGKKQVDYMTPEQIERTAGTRFKKGDVSKRWEGFEDGRISLRHDKRTGIDYYYIRVGTGKWREYHRVLWEVANGPIPKGHIVSFKDGDQKNCVLENLELKTMVDNMMRNSAAVNLSDGMVAVWMAGTRNSTPEMKDALLQHPELIEAKRLQLQLKRKIKELQNGTK